MRVREKAVVGGFSNTNFYVNSAGVGPQVAATMASLVVLNMAIEADGPAAPAVVAGRTNLTGGQGGFGWRQVTAGETAFVVVDGGGTLRVSIAIGGQDIAVERLLFPILGVYDTPNLTLHVPNISAPPVVTAGGVTAGIQNVTVGNRNAANRPTTHQVGVFYTVEGFAPADPLAYLASVVDALEQGRVIPRMRAAVVGDDHLWDARDVVTGPGVTNAIWTDQISGVALARQGRPEGFGLGRPVSVG